MYQHQYIQLRTFQQSPHESRNVWSAFGAPILFSDLGIRMASCPYIYIYMYISAILQMAALTSIFTKLKIISNGVLPSLNRTKCVQKDVLIE